MTETRAAARPLEGIRVIDLSHVLAGPICTYQMALLGAEVIKIEHPNQPDMYRGMGVDMPLAAQRMGTLYLGHSSDKRAMAIDLKDPRGIAIFRKLVATADVLVQNFRPGAAERLGIGHDDLAAINPRLVYCAISGFGQTGPYSQRPAVDHIIQGAAGVMAVTGPKEGPGLRIGYAAADTTAGFVAAIGALGALIGAIRSGRGSFVDVSMLEASVLAQGPVYYDYLNTGRPPRRPGRHGLPRRGAGGAFDTLDGKEIVVSALSFDHFKRLCRAIDRPDLLEDPRFCEETVSSDDHADTLRAILIDIFATRTAADWEERLLAASVPVGLSNSVAQVAAHPQLAHRRAFRRFESMPGIDRPLVVQGTGYQIDGQPMTPRQPPPRIGEDTLPLMRELGFPPAEIAALRAAGVIDAPEEAAATTA